MTKSPTIAQALAARIHAFGPGDLSPKARMRGRIGVIDTVAVALAGAGMDCVETLCAVPGVADAPGPCTLIGRRGRVSMLDAALVNGTAAHALDYDDFSSVFGGHQSAPILPAVFALAEAEGHGGAAVMTAYAVGVETEIRIARAVHFHHYDKGWHPTATLGTFGSAATCAHLIGLSEAQIAMALALAVSQAAGVKAKFRHHDQALSCRPMRAGGAFVGPTGAAGLYRQPGRVRAPPRVFRGLQRCGHL